MNKPQKHANLIKAWADGADIEYFDHICHAWLTCQVSPKWDETTSYRVKLKPDMIVYPSVAFSYEGDQKLNWYVKDKLKLIFDGETGKLKSAEVL